MPRKLQILPLVDMDGVLTEDERRRIIKRLHSLFSWVGSSIPEHEVISGKPLDLRKVVSDLIKNPELTPEDIEKAWRLARGIAKRERYLERVIISGNITEERALELLDEARGLLRAMDELENIRERNKIKECIASLMCKVDDEKRWMKFLDRVKTK
jgi:beta-phosphoglucomutase-like phosphatase (HAD superfamily)